MPNERTAKPRWHVYLVRNGNGALYTGVTTDVSRRLTEHREAKSKEAKCLRGKGPLRLPARHQRRARDSNEEQAKNYYPHAEYLKKLYADAR